MSKNKTIIKPAKSAPAVGPYSHGVRVGNLLSTVQVAGLPRGAEVEIEIIAQYPE